MSEILIATDGSKASDETIKYGLDLAAALGYGVSAVYVADEPIEEGKYEPTPGEEALMNAVQEGKNRGIEVERFVLFGAPATEIVKKANEIQANAIVLGSTMRTALAQWFLGSVAERVIKIAGCPVIVVRKSENGNSDGGVLNKMLIATDGSEANSYAVDAGLRLASALGTKVTAMSVNDTRDVPRTRAEEAKAEMNDRSKEAVADVMQKGSKYGINVDPLIENGIPHKEIAAVSGDYDMVVIGTLGRTGFFEAKLGSVAEKVIKFAKCPVMIVRANDHFAPDRPM